MIARPEEKVPVKNGKAVASLVCGVVSAVGYSFFVGAWRVLTMPIIAIVGLVLGILACKDSATKRSPLAVIGIIFSILVLTIFVVFFLRWFVQNN